MNTKICSNCKQELKLTCFWKTHNTQKYPDGRLNECKECYNNRINLNDLENSVFPFLEEVDVGFMRDAWDNYKNKEKNNPNYKFTIGKYLAYMNLCSNKEYRWSDTPFLEEMYNYHKKQYFNE